MLIVNPHNPLGKFVLALPLLGEDVHRVLKALISFCKDSNIHLISDEVYGLSVYDQDSKHGHEFISVLSINTHGIFDEDRIHVLASARLVHTAKPLGMLRYLTSVLHATDTDQFRI